MSTERQSVGAPLTCADRQKDGRTNGRGEANKKTGDIISELEVKFKYLGTHRKN